MSIVNSEILLNSVDISNEVISYKREQDICSGVGNLTLVTVDSFSPDPWDTVEIYENGNKVGTYYIFDEDRGASTGTKNIKAQDATKKLQSYFIEDSYQYSYVTTSKYWIQRFLNESGVSYNFYSSGNGSSIAPDTPFGMASAYELIFQLLQISGWYMYIDRDGTAQVGKLTTGTSVNTFTEDTILEYSDSTSDRMSRNSVVVWGNNDPTTGYPTFYRLTRTTDWQIDGNDIRAIVLANPAIRSISTASNLATQLLDEFDTLSTEINLKLSGFHGLWVGDTITIDTQYHSGDSVITNLSTEASKSGMITNLVLDKRCPRLVGYYSAGGIFVYIGTSSDGVWKKPVNGAVWSSFSLGLTETNVQDLIVKNSVFACVAGGKAFVNIGTTDNWQEYPKIELSDGSVTWTVDELEFVACDIDDTTGNIFWGVRTITSPNRSWVVETTSGRTFVSSRLVYVTDTSDINYRLVDVEEFNTQKVAAVEGPAILSTNDPTVGNRLDNPWVNSVNPSAQVYGLLPSSASNINVDTNVASAGLACIFNGDHVAQITSTNLIFYFYNESTASYTNISLPYTNPSSGSSGAYLCYGNFVTNGTFTPENFKIVSGHYDRNVRYTTISGLINGFTGIPKRSFTTCYWLTNTNITLYGEQTINGRSITDGRRILVKDQTNAAENGIWVCRVADWERSTLTSSAGTDVPEYGLIVLTDAPGGIRSCYQISTSNPITVGVTPISFELVLVRTLTTFTNKFNTNDNRIAYNRGKLAYFVTNQSYLEVDVFDMGAGNFIVDTDYTKFSGTDIKASQGNIYACGYGVAYVSYMYTTESTVIDGESVTAPRYNVTVYLMDSNGVTGMQREFYRVEEESLVPGYWEYYGGGMDCSVQRSFTHASGVNATLGLTGVECTGYMCDSGEYVRLYIRGCVDLRQETLQYEVCPPGWPVSAGARYMSRESVKVAIYEFPAGIQLDVSNITTKTGENVGAGWTYVDLIDSSAKLLKYPVSGNYPLSSKIKTYHISYPEKYIWDCDRIGPYVSQAIQPMGTYSINMDDLDNTIYFLENGSSKKGVFKLDPATGSIVGVYYRTFSAFSSNDNFLYTGRFFIVSSTISRIKDAFMLAGASACHLVYKLPETTGETGFKSVDKNFYSFRLESSRSDYLVGYTVPEPLIDFSALGISVSGASFQFQENLRVYNTDYLMLQMLGNFSDARVFPLTGNIYLNGVSTNLGVGTFVGFLKRYPENLLGVVNSSITTSGVITTFGTGAVGKFETSNNYSPQYMFVSVSGVSQQFWQRNYTGSSFINYSSGLPSSDVTVIRLDDTV